MKDICSRTFMVEPSKGSISELQIERFPVPSTFNYWKTNFETEVCSGSGYRKEAMPWIKEVELAILVGDLKKSQFYLRTGLPNVEILDSRIATALKKIIQNSKLQEKGPLGRAEGSKEGPIPPRTTDVACKIFGIFQVTGTHESIRDFSNLMNVTLRGDDGWDEVLLSTEDVPSDRILESLYIMRIHESAQLKTVLALHDQDIEHKNMPPSWQRLKTMVQKFWGQKMRTRNFQGQKSFGSTGDKQKQREIGQRSKGSRENAMSGRQKISVRRGDTCSFRYDDNKRGKKVHALPFATVISPTNNDGQILRKVEFPEEVFHLVKRLHKPFKDYLKGTCTDPTVWFLASSRVPELVNTSRLQVRRKVFFSTERSRLPAKKGLKEGWTKRLSSLNKDRRKVGLCIWDVEPPKVKSILRKGRKSS